VIELTSHRKIVARIVGVPQHGSAGLDRLVATGAASWSGGKPKGANQIIRRWKIAVRYRDCGSWMILFCDTSALVKLCVSETNSTLVSDRVNDAEAVAVCRNAWAKAQVTFAGHVRDNPDNTALKYV